MQAKTLTLLVASALLLVGAGCASGTVGAPRTQASAAASPEGRVVQAASYAMADVAKHKNASSCWTAIDGAVYDLTSFIGRHPGGPGAILALCGVDGSAAFNAQHGGQRRPARELAGFKIGTLE
ncbi:MAG TPA: cytochrome b5-like heme/steroid binding domain-containing protein [Patescibacteria group bacterium]|nr:cytochrome b5-like heme/steroid binding domain-containing protein [Patescibacteria group bacterium]